MRAAPSPPADAAFRIEALPRLAQVPAQTLAQLQEIGRRFKETVEQREAAEARAPRQRRRPCRARSRVQGAAGRDRRHQGSKPDGRRYRTIIVEAETRDLFIDLLLREAGFDPKAPDTIEVEVTGMPNAPGVGFVDYVLRGDDGKPLALVEAKRTRKDPRVGQQQAKLYADCLEKQYGQRPIIFYTTAMSTGSGTTRGIRRGRSRAS